MKVCCCVIIASTTMLLNAFLISSLLGWIDLRQETFFYWKRWFFNGIAAFSRHVRLSSLHKTNLEAARKSAGEGTEGDSSLGGTYRDRAEERRKKYGMPNQPPPNKLKVRGLALSWCHEAGSRALSWSVLMSWGTVMAKAVIFCLNSYVLFWCIPVLRGCI